MHSRENTSVIDYFVTSSSSTEIFHSKDTALIFINLM